MNPGEVHPSTSFPTEESHAPSKSASNIEKFSFTWHSRTLPGFDARGYKVQAPKGITYGARLTELVPLLEGECKRWFEALSVEPAKKATHALYASYRWHVKDGRERHKAQKASRFSGMIPTVPASTGATEASGLTDASRNITPSTSPRHPTELFLPAVYEFMGVMADLKKVNGRVNVCARYYNPALKQLYDAFAKSAADCENARANPGKFYSALMECYIAAMTEQYPVRLRAAPGLVQWRTGEADAKGLQLWLQNWLQVNIAAKVRVWVDQNGMHAELRPVPQDNL